jgi:predicted O-methyltransferase YrrM
MSMNESGGIDALLRELEAFGEDNDHTHTQRERRMLNITRDTGALLAVLVQARGARRLLEIGTSNGYSTLWLARAARALGGAVTTVELSDYKFALAQANFARAGLGASIRPLLADAGAVLAGAADGAYDFVFLDSERSQYQAWWPQIERVLCCGGVLVVDNATSHYAEMAAFLEGIGAHAGFTSCLVPVGKGEFIAVKAAA